MRERLKNKKLIINTDHYTRALRSCLMGPPTEEKNATLRASLLDLYKVCFEKETQTLFAELNECTSIWRLKRPHHQKL